MDWQALSLEQREKELLAEIEAGGDWKERYSFILDLGSEMKKFPEEFRLDEFKIKGCVSQVWLVAQKEDEHLRFFADSDSLFVKGLAGLLVKLFDGATPAAIAAHPTNILSSSGLIQNLSPNRSNGAASMFARFKDYARIYL